MWAYNYTYSNSLYHHGIKGMRWGVRKEYEPVRRKLARSERPKSKRRLKLEEKYISKGMNQEDAEKSAAKRAKVETFLKVAGVITVAAATAYVTTTVTKREYDTQENMKRIFDTAKNNGIMNIFDLPTIKGEHSIADDLKAVNRRYPKIRPTVWGDKNSVWETNCGFCSTAYELRRRGLDVEAVSNGAGMNWITVKSLFKDSTLLSSTPKNAVEDITRYSKFWGDGARGTIHTTWKKEAGGGGHAFSFEVKNGIPMFLDAQTNDLDASWYFEHASNVVFMRLDNLELKDNILNAVKKGG